MREARILLPVKDNSGQSLKAVHRQFQAMLANKFGGFSQSEIDGVWRNSDTGKLHRDHNIAYDIAVDGDAREALERLAKLVGYMAGQEAMYLRLPSGDVHILAV